jgi:hypothetical protein
LEKKRGKMFSGYERREDDWFEGGILDYPDEKRMKK